MWDGECWKAAGNAVETRANRFDRHAQERHGDGSAEGDDNGSRNFPGELETENHNGDRKNGQRGRGHGDGVPCFAKGLHAMEEVAGNMVHAQAEEIADLSAGNENGDAVGETDDYGTREVFDDSAHAGDTEKNEENAGHHGALEEAVDAVLGDDSGNDDDEGACGTANLRFGTAQSGDEEAGDDRAVDPGLWRYPRGDGEGHRQRQSNKAYSDAGDQIRKEFMPIVIAQEKNGFWEPLIQGGCPSSTG